MSTTHDVSFCLSFDDSHVKEQLVLIPSRVSKSDESLLVELFSFYASTCLTHVTSTLLQNIDKRLLTRLVFLDLSKAFDTLDHNLLLDKLVQSFGFSTSAWQWFFSYLTNRSQSVCANGIVSEPQKIDFGVPQDSVLGPLLFIINNYSPKAR